MTSTHFAVHINELSFWAVLKVTVYFLEYINACLFGEITGVNDHTSSY